MIVFAHRANLHGPGSGENSREAIDGCLQLGLSVEIDVWDVSGECWIGHDEPVWRHAWQSLVHPGIMCHAKNTSAAAMMLHHGVAFFCIDRDPFVLCSTGHLWMNYDTELTSKSIACSPEVIGLDADLRDYLQTIVGCYGVYTDFPLTYRKLLATTPH